MAIALEAFSVVVRPQGVEKLGGIEAFQELVPNSTFCHDDELARCAFMDRGDAVEFINSLHLRGLETLDGVDSDVVLVTAFDGTVTPCCEWLQVGPYKKGFIGWLSGSTPESIAAPSSWDPELDSNLERMSTEEAARRLQFLRREENVEVFLDRDTGRELYVGRTGLPLDAMFEEAREFVVENMRDPGAPLVASELESEFRRIIQMLQILSERRAESWTVHWLLGKAWHAIGDSQRAYTCLQRAYALESEIQAITRELAGICLELGKAQEAVMMAERAVASEPENADLLSNLALAYLTDGRVQEAETTINAALKHASSDSIAQAIHQVIREVAAGTRPQPRSLSDLDATRRKTTLLSRILAMFRRT